MVCFLCASSVFFLFSAERCKGLGNLKKQQKWTNVTNQLQLSFLVTFTQSGHRLCSLSKSDLNPAWIQQSVCLMSEPKAQATNRKEVRILLCIGQNKSKPELFRPTPTNQPTLGMFQVWGPSLMYISLFFFKISSHNRYSGLTCI